MHGLIPLQLRFPQIFNLLLKVYTLETDTLTLNKLPNSKLKKVGRYSKNFLLGWNPNIH